MLKRYTVVYIVVSLGCDIYFDEIFSTILLTALYSSFPAFSLCCCEAVLGPCCECEYMLSRTLVKFSTFQAVVFRGVIAVK